MKFNRKQAGVLLLACLVCILGIAGCRKNDAGDQQVISSEATPTTAASTPTPTPMPTPTPTPEPWELYERIGETNAYRVPVEEIKPGLQIVESSMAGDYALLHMWGPEWSQYLLLRPALSGEAAAFETDIQVRSMYVLADGTVFLEDGMDSVIHVYDRTFTETGTIVPDGDTHPILMAVTDDGHIWRFDKERSCLILSDRDGGNTQIFETVEGRSAYQDLGGSNGKRYFLAMNSEEEYTSDVILCADEASGTVTEPDEEILNVTMAEKASYLPVTGKTLYDLSNETWYLHLLAGNGHRIALPHRYQYEIIDSLYRDSLCVSGYIWGSSGELTSWIKPSGCAVYDIANGTMLGELTSTDLAAYKSVRALGRQDNGMVLIAAGNPNDDGFQNEELLIWNIEAQEPAPVTGFFDLTEEDPAGCLARLIKDYREKYGIVYEPSDMKTISGDEKYTTLQRMDFFNRLARGIAQNPEEFPRGADGTALHLENIHGHERGHAQFEPHIFSDMSRDFYGEEQEQSFYNMVDAIRAGEDTFDSSERILYNWSVARFSTWYYPVSTACIETSYSFYDKEQWKNGKGLIRYTVTPEEAAGLIREFEQLICDTLDDCIADDYTDFEKALALYEYITENWTYDHEMYEHINEYEWTSKGSIYRCLKERLGICWEIAGLYEYLLLQCGIGAEDAEGTNTVLDELHAWAYITLGEEGYNVDPTWGLSDGRAPELRYFCFTDKEREERDNFPFDTCFILGTDEMMRPEQGIFANDETYAELWPGYYIGLDRTAKKVIYEDVDGILHGFSYEN